MLAVGFTITALVLGKSQRLAFSLGFQSHESQDSSHTRGTVSDAQGLSCGLWHMPEGLFSFVGKIEKPL